MRTKTLAATLATLAPFNAFAHVGEHADQSAFNQLTHMISDPVHLALAGLGIVAGIVSWKLFQSYKMASVQDEKK